ncbi:hypothetical protein [Bdellovibrio sp. NC01]|uniref:hypothetical protein n=1 Tax=Bdellovibrio sp. NC01 TaxID=2220073 RepID=UPI00115B13DF|nr:hypothetical protein [Bdellovibrio sp. NC01]QDK39274.1 hypothetical protein DOE51_17595 [Bdellovibrio sp. NC01]
MKALFTLCFVSCLSVFAQAAPVDAPLAFPSTEIGSRSHMRYDLTAPADASLLVTAMTLDGTNFWVESNCLGELPKGLTCYVDVMFDPTEAKSYSSTMVITTSVDTYTLHLTGTGTTPAPKPPRLTE